MVWEAHVRDHQAPGAAEGPRPLPLARSPAHAEPAPRELWPHPCSQPERLSLKPFLKSARAEARPQGLHSPSRPVLAQDPK